MNVTYYKTMNLSGQLLQLGSYNCHHTIIIPPQQHAVRKNNVGVVWFVLVIMVAHLRRKKKMKFVILPTLLCVSSHTT